MKVDLKYAERQLRHWTRKVGQLRLTSNAFDAKETEEGKEEIPPTPPIEEKGEGKEKAGEEEDARAREVFSSRNERVAAVARYNAKLDGNIDAEFFVDYYADKWPSNWRARFRNWLKSGKKMGRIKPPEPIQAEAPRTFTEADWTLCAERCVHFQGGKCRRGFTTPPELGRIPHPPEECPKFKNSTKEQNHECK